MHRLMWLFDTRGFVPRWECGRWSSTLGWSHIIADLLIFLAYSAIPVALTVLVIRRRDAPYPLLLALFAGFILFCGGTHLVEAIIFYCPIYRFAAVLKATTAVISLLTAAVLIRTLPAVLAAPAILRERMSLRQELDKERRKTVELAEEREPIARRSAELTSRTRRLTDALAAGRVVALRWSVASGEIMWEIGMSETARLSGLSPFLFRNWNNLIAPADAARLAADAMEACQPRRLLEFEAQVAAQAGLMIRLTANPDAAVAGEPRTATGMFRIIGIASNTQGT